MGRLSASLPADAEDQRAVERAAGARFVAVGMAEVAADDPMSAERLVAYARAGRSWVATDRSDRVVGYVVVELIDGCAHVEQISVDPEHQGQGLGQALIDEVERWAAARGLEAMTLTTFAEVPWNRPLYEHLGFRVLREEELSPGLRALRTEEAARGLDRELRVCMRRPVRRQSVVGSAMPDRKIRRQKEGLLAWREVVARTQKDLAWSLCAARRQESAEVGVGRHDHPAVSVRSSQYFLVCSVREVKLLDVERVVSRVTKTGRNGRRQVGVDQQLHTGSTAGSSRSCIVAAAKPSA